MKMTVNSGQGRFALALLSAGMLAASGATHAATAQVGATIKVIKALSISSASNIDFGKLSAPTDVDAVWDLKPDGVGGVDFQQTSGSDSVNISDDQDLGSFNLVAEETYPIEFTVAVKTDFSSPDLSLVIDGDNISKSSPITIPTGAIAVFGSVPIWVGGELTVKVGATPGVNGGGDAALVEMVANYQ